jgi:type IV secretion system protein VirD4
MTDVRNLYEARPEDARVADIDRDAHAMGELLGREGIWFGSIIGTNKDANYSGKRHLLTVAPTRSGKGACAIIPNLLMQTNMSIICVDPKGQNMMVTASSRIQDGTEVLPLNPFREHDIPTVQYNPLASLRIDDPNVDADIAGLSEALIVTEGTDPHWANSARDLVGALMLHLVATEGGGATLPKMRTLLTQPDSLFNETIAEMGKSKYAFIAQPAVRFLHDTREIKGIISTAITQTKFLDNPGIAHVLSGSSFSMLDFKKRRMTLYVVLPSRYMAAFARFLRLIVVSAIDHLTSRPGGIPTLFILDEFAQLGHLSAIENAFGLAAGYNVQLWPFVQDLNQLKKIYGERWESFIANAGVVQWFTPNDQFTAEYLSKRCGKRSMFTKAVNESTSFNYSAGGKNPSRGQNVTANYNEVVVDLYSPQDLYQLAEDGQLLTLSGLKYPVRCARERYYEFSGDFEIFRNAAGADPFHQ